MFIAQEFTNDEMKVCREDFTQTLLPEDMDIIQHTPLLAEMSEDDLNRILDESSLVNLPCGERLFLRGEQVSSIYLILDGGVKIYRDAPKGKQAVIEILTRGELIAEEAIFLGQGYPTSAEIISDTRLLEIPSSTLLSLLQENNDLAIRMLGRLSQKQCELVFHIEQIKNHSASQRLGEFLLSLCVEKRGPAVLRLPYNKLTIAASLGMKPESLSRAMSKLKTYGVSVKSYDVILSDIAVLRRFCVNGS
ncbi:MAG: Crp/Fnr family transcriptional regulator [Rhodospirillaceae bacterium]|nr:Crp/Fnr family transcriptional regulator [Rhodospirillaceae bacterium]